jgi:hypothetical protein
MASHNEPATPAKDESDTPIATSEGQIDKPVPKEPTGNVKSPIMSIAGHYFRINYDVPQDVTNRLFDLFLARGRYREATYADIPEDLKAYEVVLICGRLFRYNGDVREDIRERLEKYSLQSEAHGFRFEDVPEDLMAYRLPDNTDLRDDPNYA